MKNTNRNLVLGGVGLIILAGIVWFISQQSQRAKMPAVEGCPGETFEFTVNDANMAGIVEQGATVRVVKNFYRCNPIEKGDVVLYRFSELRDPVVRIARAVPGDMFKLMRTKDKTAWNIEINEEVLELDGKPFRFGSDATPVLSLYEKSSMGKLDEKTIILFGVNPPYENDSTTLGALSISDVVGKVLLGNEPAPTPVSQEAKPMESNVVPQETEGGTVEPATNSPEEKSEDTNRDESRSEETQSE